MTRALTSYFERGYRFHKLEPGAPSRKHEAPVARGKPETQDKREKTAMRAVFLIHGWGVRAISMGHLASALADAGFTVYNYDYPTSERTIAEHSDVFLSMYRAVLNADNPAEVYFVTHSMGGLLLRAALAQMSEAECRRVEAVVMLGPPNRGSALAYFGDSRGVRGINASLADMTPSPESYVMNIPPPPFLPPVGIVAGKFDGKVSPDSTLLPEGQPCERIVVPCTHPGLRNPKHTLAPILNFFRTKAF